MTSKRCETWRDVPGHSGYQVSNLGRVRSLRRSNPRVLTGTIGPCGYLTVGLAPDRESARIGTLVAAAWLGPRPDGAVVRRLDGDPLNDRPENLAYGTPEEESADYAARCRREDAAGAPTHCDCGRPYEDTYLGDFARRLCIPCRNERIYAGRRDNPARLAQVKRRHYQTNRDEILAKNRARYGYQAKPAAATCEDCSAEVVNGPGGGSGFRRCPDCQQKRRREQQRRYNQKRAAAKRATTT